MTEPHIPITMALQDWQVCRAGLLELPGKIGLPVLVKLEQQLLPHMPPQAPNGGDRPPVNESRLNEPPQ